MPLKSERPEIYYRGLPFERIWSDDKRQRWLVKAAVTFDARGLRFTKLEISPAAQRKEPPAISARVLQRLPLRKWIREYALERSDVLMQAAEKAPWAAMPRLQKRLKQIGQGPRRRSTDFYGEVVTVYRTAQASGVSPTKAVAAHFEVSPSRAATWVYRARKYNFLPKTAQGVARG